MSGPFPEQIADFDDPLGLLKACHARMLERCEWMQALAAQAGETQSDDTAQQTATDIVRYFNTAARHHHQDEEQDIFPLLIRQSMKLAEAIHSLKKEHENLERLWSTLEPMLRRLNNSDPGELQTAVDAFCEATRTHLRTEEREVLYRAEAIISSKQLREIGKSMAKRRGLK